MIALAILAAALFLIVGAVALNGRLAARNATRDTRASQTLPCPFPSELLPNVFSTRDWQFVRSLETASVRRLFRRERKAVAQTWVAETSAALNIVMREHVLAARHSSNLNPLTEITLLAGYLFLLFLCGLLSIAIRVAGPLWLGSVAQLTQKTFDQIARSHRLLQPAQASEALAGVRN